MGKQWRGQLVRRSRLALADRTSWPAPCARCGRPLQRSEAWHLGHIIGRDEAPDLIASPSNWQVECPQCSASSGAAYGNRKRGRRPSRNPDSFQVPQPRHATPRLCPITPSYQEIGTPFTDSAREPGEFDGFPLMFPGPHPQAVDSLADHAVQWIEGRMRSDTRTRGDALRWWQWLVLQRLLEVRADGSWCWPVALVSVSRQQGKSELLCEMAAWRCAHPGLFGGWPQEVGHSASTVVISRKIQSSRWPWAQGLDMRVARQLGDTQITWPDGSTWRTMAPENMYGRSLDLILADEAWSWDATNFWQATYPTMVERPQSQAVLWSAAHDTPKTLISTLFKNQRIGLMSWGAPGGCDIHDPKVWRRASAHWSPAREEAMALAHDQPSFGTQWLNMWPDDGAGTWLPAPLLDMCAREELRPGEPVAASLECDVTGRNWSAAWIDTAGAVSVFPPGRLDDACAWLKGVEPPILLAHGTVIARLPEGIAPARPITPREQQASISVFAEQVRSGAIIWDHGPAVAEHISSALLIQADGGPRLIASKSRGDVSLVKAIAAVAWHASQKREPVLV
jgi:HNH endonuclease